MTRKEIEELTKKVEKEIEPEFKKIEEICKKVRKTIANDEQEEIIEQDIEQIKAGNYISKIDKYFDCFYDKQETVIDYLNQNSIITFDEIRKIEQRAQNVIKDNDNLIKNLIEKGKVVPQAISNIQTFSSIENNTKESEKTIIYIEKQDTKIERQAQNYNFQYRAINYYKSEIETLFEKKGWQAFCSGYVPCGLARPRTQEIYAVLNRYRG